MIPATERQADSATAAHLERYFGQWRDAFDSAGSRVSRVHERTFRLAGYSARLRMAGEALVPVLTPALEHLPDSPSAPTLDLCCWDGAETGCGLPPPPWEWPAAENLARMSLPAGAEKFRIAAAADFSTVSLYRVDSGQGFFWSRDAKRIPTHQHGSPFLSILCWWAETKERTLMHAGCVGTKDGSVLLVGKGGSGKSTTALLGLEAGMNYLSDDYCLLQPAPVPTVWSVYNTGKLHRDHLARFPSLAALAVDPSPDGLDKPVIFVHRHMPRLVTQSLPLKAVVLPIVTPGTETRLEPVTAAEALRALAPSTLFQLPQAGPAAFRQMAALVRTVPGYRLRLGSRLEAIAPVLQTLLANPG